MIASLRRIYGLLLRQFYAVRRAPPRIATLVFWPALQMMMWGLFNKYLHTDYQVLGFSMSMLLGAALLLTFIERTNANVMVAFMEDIWTRNLGNISITPTRTIELGISLLVTGTIAAVFGVTITAFGAYLIFGYSLLSLGLTFFLWWLCLTISGWCIGLLLVSMLLRLGAGNEPFGWMAAMALSPFFCVFYPVDSLSQGLQSFAWFLPPVYVFENLRHFLKSGIFDYYMYVKGVGLAIIYFLFSLLIFFRQLQQRRISSGLFNVTA